MKLCVDVEATYISLLLFLMLRLLMLHNIELLAT